MFDGSLILEGGGMRGVYTAGVLDLFMEKGFQFKNIYAVSAGACHACSYISGQPGRAFKTVTNYIRDRRYASVSSFLLTGDFFGVQLNYDDIPNRLLPIDFESFIKNETAFFAVLTNCRTGKAEYRRIRDLRNDMSLIRASSSLPLLARCVEIGGEKYLDGGISDSVPLAKAIKNGSRKNLVVLTQHRGYVKGKSSLMTATKLRYRRFPELVKSIQTRHLRYNETLKLVFEEESRGNAFVLHPKEPASVGRLEKDFSKLKALYRRGYEDAKAAAREIRRFFEGV